MCWSRWGELRSMSAWWCWRRRSRQLQARRPEKSKPKIFSQIAPAHLYLLKLFGVHAIRHQSRHVHAAPMRTHVSARLYDDTRLLNIERTVPILAGLGRKRRGVLLKVGPKDLLHVGHERAMPSDSEYSSRRREVFVDHGSGRRLQLMDFVVVAAALIDRGAHVRGVGLN